MEGYLDKAKININLLGAPAITRDGEPFDFSRKQQRALLYFLACQTQPVTRTTLINLFWPNLSEAQGRKNLREAISLLRKTLGGEEYVETNAEVVSLNPRLSESDVIKYQEIVDRVHYNLESLPTGKLPESLYVSLREAINLWRTPQFMQGFMLKDQDEFETWMMRTGQSLEYWRQLMIERLADHNIFIGNIDEGLYWLQAALESDPLNTDLHYLTLTCLRDLGRISEIQRYHDYLTRIYVREQGESVPNILTDFISRINESSRMLDGSQMPVWPSYSRLPIQFVGRKSILNLLNINLPRGGIFLLEGESGIGKSRLIEEFYTRLETPVRLLYCIARPMEHALPFQPVIDGLRLCVKPEEWKALPLHVAEKLVNLFPELNNFRTDLDQAQRNLTMDSYQVMLESLVHLLQSIAEKKRLLVILDDAQWCDEATISLLSFMNERGLFKRNGFLIIASRIEQQNPVLEEFISIHENSESFHRHMLEYLSEKEISDLIYLVIGKTASEETVKRIARDTGGNPLFVLETLRSMMEFPGELDAFNNLDRMAIAPGVQSLMMERIKNLDSDSVLVVTTAAVLGSKVTPDLIELACHLDKEKIVSALELLERMRILVPIPELMPAGGYAFSHEKIRETIIGSLSLARKRLYSIRAAEAIKTRYANTLSYSAILAQYYETAGETLEAFHYWIRAAFYARSLYSQKDTYAAYKHAIDLVSSYEDLFPDSEIHTLITLWADYAYDLDDAATCEKVYTYSYNLGEKRKSPLLIGTGVSGKARVAGMREQLNSALTLITSAIRYLTTAESEGELVEAYNRQGIIYHLLNDFPHARESYEKAVFYPLKEKNWRTREALVNAQTQLVLIYSLTGWPRKAEELALRNCEESEMLHRQSARPLANTVLAVADYYLGKYSSAIELINKTLKETESLQMHWWTSLLYGVVARCYLAVGYLDEGWNAAQNAIKISVPARAEYLAAHAHGMLGNLYRVMGHLDEAEMHYRKGIMNAINFQSLENTYLLGHVMMQKGELDEGMGLLRSVYSAAKEMDLGTIYLPISHVLVSFEKNSKPEEVLQEMDEIYKETASRGFATTPISAQLSKVRILLENKQYPEAEELVGSVIQQSHRLANVWVELAIAGMVVNEPHFSENLKHQVKIRARSILDQIAEHANAEPCSSIFTKYAQKMIANQAD